MRESNGSTIVSDNVWDFVGTNGLCFNFQKLEFSFISFDGGKGESTLDIIEHSVMLVSLSNRQDIHNTNGESGISSDFVVDFKSSVFIHDSKSNFLGSQCKI